MLFYYSMSVNLRIQPEIFIPKESNSLQIRQIYLEQRHPQIDIFWYHWPQDGIFVGTPDYEPIILIFSENNELKIIASRKAWDYQPYSRSELFSTIQIVFGGVPGILESVTAGFHHPYFHLLGFDADFQTMSSNKIHYTYGVMPIDPSKIPDIARTGKKHPSLALKGRSKVIDPFDWALKYIQDIDSWT
jgi:hypothetical protein